MRREETLADVTSRPVHFSSHHCRVCQDVIFYDSTNTAHVSLARIRRLLRLCLVDQIRFDV